ncbi:hypothetical protein KA037_03915 [Patescibacteria group bacterium]|nr:hypothetical protein [Patescibacteria group bacterium]MBP7841787.1 hypothetical protein [Patescibacteria group bacterium]
MGDAPLDDIHDCAHHAYDERIADESDGILRITTVDGQYNARESAVKQCFMQFEGFDTTTPLRCSRIISLKGNISPEQLKTIENYLVNPLEEKTLDISDSNLQKNILTPEDVQYVS